jgi:hypothetical protein
MKIAKQCQKGSYNHCNHEPVCDWPYDTYIQWGDNGIVVKNLTDCLINCDLSKENTKYFTAFFEAFVTEPDTFIRGEGYSIEDAEKNAYNKLLKYRKCTKHKFEKRGYTNGAGICKHCGIFQCDIFPPEEICVDCNIKTYGNKLKDNTIVCDDCFKIIDINSERLTSTQKRVKDMLHSHKVFMEKWKKRRNKE